MTSSGPSAGQPVTLACPSCGATLHLPVRQLAGQRVVECQYCGAEVWLNSGNPLAGAPAAPAATKKFCAKCGSLLAADESCAECGTPA